MIQVYTGDGKGKTTAALGLLMRAVARNKRCAIIAFDKGGNHYAERDFIATHLPEVDLFATGLDRMDTQTETFRFGVTADDKAEGERGLEILKNLLDQNLHDLIILDEINCSVDLEVVDEHQVLNLLKTKPEHLELILTGRNAPQSFIDLADLVTDMRMNKHYLSKGIKARDGFDY